MEIEIVRDVGDLEAVGGEWTRLAEARGDAFLTPDWFRAAHDQLGEDSPMVVLGRVSGGLAGVLPLTVTGRLRAAGFPAAAFGDRYGLLAEASDERRFSTAAGQALLKEGAVGLVILRHVDEREEWPEGIREGSRRALSRIDQRFAAEPLIPLDRVTWDQYLGSRSSSFRKRVRYLERSLMRDPGFEVREADPSRIAAELDSFYRLHDLRWGGGAESSIAAPRARAFIRDFATRASRRGWLRLRFLEVGGVPAAALLGWRVGDRFAFYQAGFDPAYSKRSVGMLLVALTIRSAIDEGAAEFDFLLGAEDYKWRFASEKRTVRTITLVPSGSPVRALVAAEAWARRHSGALEERPAILRMMRRLSPTSRV